MWSVVERNQVMRRIPVPDPSKGNAVPVYTMRGYRGKRGTALLFLNLGARWTWVDSFMSESAVWREPWYPSNRWPGGPQRKNGHCGEMKNSDPCQDSDTGLSSPQHRRHTTTELPPTPFFFNNLDWGPVPHFCPLEVLQPVWLMPEAYCTIPVF
jgi:hypothetical protein